MSNSAPSLLSIKGTPMHPDFSATYSSPGIAETTATMTSHRFRRIPVADKEGKLVGVMSLGDVHKAVFHLHVSK